jgi:heme A synthase
MSGTLAALAADLIVAFHSLYVLFAVGGEFAILAGALLRWAWIRSRWFRFLHLAAVVFVAVEAFIGMACPLTVWEYELRRAAGQSSEEQISFIARIIRALIFYDFPPWVFTALYIGFAAVVLLTFVLIPPRRRLRPHERITRRENRRTRRARTESR